MHTNAEMISLALDRITSGYVFPQRVAEIEGAIRRQLAAGAYDTLSGPALCEAVTAHLQEVCPDRHLRLLWLDEPQSMDPADEDEGRAAFLAKLRAENQGIRRFEHLVPRQATFARQGARPVRALGVPAGSPRTGC
ncbi:peptidase S41, partial [Streptomyces sp. NPDC001455]